MAGNMLIQFKYAVSKLIEIASFAYASIVYTKINIIPTNDAIRMQIQ